MKTGSQTRISPLASSASRIGVLVSPVPFRIPSTSCWAKNTAMPGIDIAKYPTASGSAAPPPRTSRASGSRSRYPPATTTGVITPNTAQPPRTAARTAPGSRAPLACATSTVVPEPKTRATPSRTFSALVATATAATAGPPSRETQTVLMIPAATEASSEK